MVNQPELHQAHEQNATYFKRRLNEIINRELDAKEIATYANTALLDLVALIEDVVSFNGFEDTELSGIERERQALMNIGLDPLSVEATLDHIADTKESIERLGGLIAKKAKVINKVIVPSNIEGAFPVTHGTGTFEARKTIPKLETLLLLLEKGLSVNIESDQEVMITVGILPEEMMRSKSYSLVEIPSIDRAVLTCDDAENVTYVFDMEVCEENGITPEKLIEKTKDELNALLSKNMKLGARIKYSPHYASRLNAVLTEPIDSAYEAGVVKPVPILKPKKTVNHIPEGYRTVSEIGEEKGWSKAKIRHAMNTLGEDIFGEIIELECQGDRGIYTKQILSQEQQNLLEQYYNYDIPDGYITFQAMADRMGITHSALAHITRQYKDELGELKPFRHGLGAPTRIISPAQQEYLEQSNYAQTLDHVPPGFKTNEDMAEVLNLSISSVKSLVNSIYSELGPIKRYRKPGGRGGWRNVYSPEQQEMLIKKNAVTKRLGRRSAKRQQKDSN